MLLSAKDDKEVVEWSLPVLFYVLVPVLVVVVDYVVAVTVFFLIVNIFTHGTDNVEGGCSVVSVLFLNIPYSRTYLSFKIVRSSPVSFCF